MGMELYECTHVELTCTDKLMNPSLAGVHLSLPASLWMMVLIISDTANCIGIGCPCHLFFIHCVELLARALRSAKS